MSRTAPIAGVQDRAPTALLSRVSLTAALTSGRIIRSIPQPLRAWSCDRVADAAFLLAGTYRENALRNARQVLGPGAPASLVRRTARDAFRTSVRNMADLLRFQGSPPSAFARAVDVTDGDWGMVNRAAAGGRGFVLVTAHLGAFDGLCQIFVASGFRPTAVVGRTLPRPIFEAAIALRVALGLRIVEATPNGIRRLVEALRSGECVAFPIDRDFFRNGTPVDFFGRRTTLPTGAVRLAREANVPIVAAYLRRSATGFELTLEEPFVVPRTADRRADITSGMEAMVASLTRAVAASPGQWAVFQPVWPHPGADTGAPSRCGSRS
jgi:lauroyl/myristoyl acyltransferase